MHLAHFPIRRVSILSAPRGVLDGFHYDLLIEALVGSSRPVIFLDGNDSLNGYEFAERNIQRGNPADFGADRLLTSRAMTPYQWTKMLTTQLHDHLRQHEPSLVVAAHFNVQYDKDDLVDWQQEDHVASTLRYLRRLAHHHDLPILLTLDLARWTRTHPATSSLLLRAGLPLRRVLQDPRGYTLLEGERVLVEPKTRWTTLDAWLEPEPVPMLAV